MSEQGLVSIIVPVYNIEGYLPRCLETIAAQTYANLDIILVDDGSTDKSGEICDHFAEMDKRARVIHQMNQGTSAARNLGLKEARGDYLMFVDGDDYLHVDIVKVLYEAISRTIDIDISICSYKRTTKYDEDICTSDINRYNQTNPYNMVKRSLRLFGDHLGLFTVWGKLYRKHLIRNIIFRDYAVGEDCDFNLGVFPLARQIIMVNRPLYYYVQRNTSVVYITSSKEQYRINVDMFYDNVKNRFSNNDKFRSFPLALLYRRMVLWIQLNYNNKDKGKVVNICRLYERQTIKEYLLCWRINAIEKIVMLTMLHNFRLAHWMLIRKGIIE